MSGREAGPASAPAPSHGPVPEPESEVPPGEPHRLGLRTGRGTRRRIVAPLALCVAAAAAVMLVWPLLRGQRAPHPEAPAPPPPPVPPSPVVTQAPEPAPPPEPAAAPPSEPEVVPAAPPGPVQLGPRARFEPGTVTVGKLRRPERQRLDRNDRRLLDLLARKQDGPAPPEPVEKLDLDTARSLDPAAVERVMAENEGAFSGCVTRAAKRGPEGQQTRKATLFLTVAGSGEVAKAWVAEADVSRTDLGRCIATAARRLVFPAFEGERVDVSVPLVLEAR